MKTLSSGRRIMSRVLLVMLLAISVACSQDVNFNSAQEVLSSGEGSRKVSQVFTQGTEGKMLDIIMVVDNSTSMAAEQEKLGDRIDTFLQTLDGVDWRVGITTTDVSAGLYGLRGSLLEFGHTGKIYIDPQTPNHLELFKATVVRGESLNCAGECPSGNEEGLTATMMAVDKRNSDNAGFFREGADLGVLYLSDEDEQSTGPISATKPQDVLNKMNEAFADEKRLLSYGIILMPSDLGCYAVQAPDGNFGDFVADLAAMTGGLVGSICDNDYAPTLGKIADHAKELLRYVELGAAPITGSVSVRFVPAHSSGFVMDGRRVRILNPPAEGTQIIVDYSVRE